MRIMQRCRQLFTIGDWNSSHEARNKLKRWSINFDYNVVNVHEWFSEE